MEGISKRRPHGLGDPLLARVMKAKKERGYKTPAWFVEGDTAAAE